MALSAFEDKKEPPDPKSLAAALGKSASHWTALKRGLEEDHGSLTEQWNYAGAKFGWSLRLKRGDRIVIYLIPCSGRFLAGLVFGNRAVEAIRASRLPRPIIAMVEEAKTYAEGRGVRFEVRLRKDVDHMRKLAAIKMST